MQYNHLKNKKMDQNYADFSLTYRNNDITTFRYLQDKDKQGIKIENVLAKYVVVENKELKDFLYKFGMKDSSKFPDSLLKESIKEFFLSDKENIYSIFNSYKTIFTESLTENNFQKTVNKNKSTTISLIITEDETANILKKYLMNLKNDNDTLKFVIKKADELGYKLNIDSLKTYLQEKIDEINLKDFDKNNEFIKIDLTSNEEKTCRIGISILFSDSNNEENKKEYSFNIDISDSNKINLDIKENNNKYTVNITFRYEGNGISTNIEIDKIDNELNQNKNIAKILHRVNNYTSNRINQDLALTYNKENDSSSMTFDISNTILLKQDIEIEKINEQNSLILNDKTKEEIQGLIKAIIDRMDFVFGDKLNVKEIMSKFSK